jgi:putative iron-regulated protein
MKKLIILLFISALSFSCSDQKTEMEQQLVENYANIVYANYEDAYIKAKELQTKIDEFVSNPTEEGFTATKNAWLDARPVYSQTEAFRFYSGPIDDEEGLEPYINSWPLDENFIDYVVNPNSGKIMNTGIINDPESFQEISAEVLLKENEIHGEADVKVGYHAIEFLLWGQDLYEESAGKRSFTDYTTAPNAERRKTYLKVVSALLVEHLETLKDAWKHGSEYRSAFVKKENVRNSMINILTGIGKLSKGELAGERMTVAMENKDQEDEHSCFSDNTHNDIIYNQMGMLNVYLGKYKRIDGTVIEGPGFDALVTAYQPESTVAITASFQDALKACQEIPAPFDQAILHHTDKIQSAVRALRKQSDEVQNIASVLGLTLVIPETNE